MTPSAAVVFLLPLLGLMFGLLVIAAFVEGIEADVRRGASGGSAPSPDCGCAACRGTADVGRQRP